jgi:hypothetical protein
MSFLLLLLLLLGVVSQAINILKIRQTLTKADRNTLIEGTLEMAQLQCNLSMVSTTAATEHHSSERRSTLRRFAWIRARLVWLFRMRRWLTVWSRILPLHLPTETLWRSAWQTYLDILLDYSAAVKPIFLSEIEEAMTLEKTDDVHYPGKIGMATSLCVCVCVSCVSCVSCVPCVCRCVCRCVSVVCP